MGLSRNTVVRPTDLNLPGLQIPFEAIYGQMQQYQSDYDTMGQLSSIVPKYIEKDTEWAGKYKQYANEISTAVTDAFASGDTAQALRTLRSGQQALASEWKPGGLANALQERYTAYSSGLETLQKAHEKDPTQINYQYGQHIFNTGIKDLEYDYTSQKYNSIGKPNIYNYTDVSARLRDEVKTIIPDVTENDIVSGFWIHRLKQKGYDDARIKSVWQGVLNSPEIQQQLAVEAYNKIGNMTEDEKFKYMGQAADQVKAELKDVSTQLSKLSVIDRQKYLKSIGLYNGPLDGKDGPMTKEATDALKNQYKNKYKQIYSTDIDQFLANEFVVKPYEKQFMGYFGQETSKLVRPNTVALQQQRLKHAEKLQNQEFMFYQNLQEKESRGGVYTPTQSTDVVKHFNDAKKAANDIVVNSEKDLKKLGENPAIQKMYGANGKEDWQQNMKTAVAVMEMNIPDEEKGKKLAKWLGLSDEAASDVFMDLTENAATYKQYLVTHNKAVEAVSRINNQEEIIYKDAAKDKMKEIYAKNKLAGESYDNFTKSFFEAAKMTVAQLKNAAPELKRFWNGNKGYSAAAQNVNLAAFELRGIQSETAQKIKSGKYIPNSSVRFSISGTSNNYGAGRISDAVRQDMKAGSLYGYEDFSTGNRDEFTDIHGKKVKLEDLDPSTVNVEYDAGWGQPSYILTAKSKDKKFYTLRVKPPKTHDNLIMESLDQEFAIGVNDGNLESAARAARFREEHNGNLLDIAGASIKPNNKNITGEVAELKMGNSVYSLERPFTTSYSSDYANGYKLEVITFNDKDGKQKWATALRPPEGPVTLVGKSEKRDGTIKPNINHTNVSDVFFRSYDEAIDNTLLLKTASEIPVNQVYETIPKDLKGINLPGSKVVIDNNNEEEDNG